MAYAKRRMPQYPGLHITEIVEAAGFVRPGHFTRIFKARERESFPSSWRKTQGGENSISQLRPASDDPEFLPKRQFFLA